MGQHLGNGAGQVGSNPFLIRDGQDIYVSPYGDDKAADGSFDAPVKTLEKALQMAEKLSNYNKPVDIYLREGVYYISDTINMSYNGEWYAPLTISAYKNEDVTINGGFDIALSDMETADEAFTSEIIDRPADGAVLQYSLKDAGITDYGEISRRGHLISAEQEAQAELSLDGFVQKLAGWPNDGYTGLIKPSDPDEYGTRTIAGIANGCSFAVDYDRPSLWSRQDEAWLAGTLGPNYEFDYYPVSSFDNEEKRVYLREGALVNYYTEPHYRFENVPEELDAPGEYYIDRDTGMLYFYPPKNAAPDSVLTVTMPTRNGKAYEGKAPDDLIRIENCSNIIFKDLTFKGGRGSGITGRYSRGITFENCEINSFGAHGIRFDFSTSITVRGCSVHDVGQDGIQFTNCGDYQNIISNNNVICNNEIYNFARLERSYKSGVNLGYRCVGAVVARNHIHSGPHTGLIFYGVNNDIYGNEFNDLVTEFSDMDAIYANNSCYPWERGNKIHGNYFHDIGRSSMNGRHQINVRAIRTDNKGCGIEVFGNLFLRIGDGGANGNGNNAVGAVTAEGTRNKIFNNLFVDCNETYTNGQAYREIETASDGTLYPNTTETGAANTINGVAVAVLKEQLAGYLPVYGAYFPELYDFFYEHPNMSKTNEFKDNIIINIAFPLSDYNGVPSSEGFRGSELLTEASGNYVGTEDPGFMDYAGGNLELSEEAKSLVKGFPNMLMSSFGTMD